MHKPNGRPPGHKTLILFVLIFVLMFLIFFEDPCNDWNYEDTWEVVCE